jgi:hypothetical protein
MSTGLDRIASDRIGWSGFGWTRIGVLQSSDASRARLFKARLFKARLLLLSLALAAAGRTWLVMSGSRGGITGGGTPTLAAAMVQPSDDPVSQER